MIGRIVAGVDLVEGVPVAVEWARALGTTLGVPVEALHVVTPPVLTGQPFVEGGVVETELVEAARRAAEARVARDAVAPIPLRVATGRPHEELAHAGGEGTVLVVGAGTRRWFNTLVGTTTDRLLRVATGPVLVVRGAPVRITRVVAALELSEGSERLLQIAGGWATALGARLVAFHAPQPLWSEPLPGLDPSFTVGTLSETPQEGTERARKALESIIARAGIPGVETELASYARDPSRSVAEAGEAEGTLVVTGTHGRSGLDRAVLGSVAEGVVQRARGPVLVVPGAG